MKTTRAMLVIGVLMLMLAVIVAQGLRPDETPTVSGPAISGAISKAPESVPADQAPTTASQGGMLVPLDAGTLKMDSTTPVGQLAPVSPAPESTRPVVAPLEAPKTDASAPGSSSGVTSTVSSQATQNAPVADKAKDAGTQPKPEVKTEPKAEANAPKERKLVVTTAAPQKLAPGQKAISRTRLEIGKNSATFRLTGASALQGKAFVLKEPDRVVVDLNGAWGINLGKTPANSLIKSVRAGSQEANTRLVFDMVRAPKNFRLVQVAPKTLELQIR